MVGVAKDALHRAFRGGLDDGADFLVGRGLFQLDREVHDRNVGGGHAERHAGKLLVEGGNHLADRFRGTGRGRDDVFEDAASAAPVLVARSVHSLLRGGGRMDGRHETALDAERVVDDLGQRGQAVGRAARVRDDRFAGVALVVHAIDEHRGLVLGWSGEDDFLGSGLEVRFGGRLVQKEAGGFDHDFGSDFIPLERGRILDGGEADFVAVDDQAAVLDRDFPVEATVDGVVFEHVGEILGFEQVVDADHLDVFAEVLDGRAEDHASDASEAVDTDFDHCDILFVVGLSFEGQVLKNSPREASMRNRADS